MYCSFVHVRCPRFPFLLVLINFNPKLSYRPYARLHHAHTAHILPLSLILLTTVVPDGYTRVTEHVQGSLNHLAHGHPSKRFFICLINSHRGSFISCVPTMMFRLYVPSFSGPLELSSRRIERGGRVADLFRVWWWWFLCGLAVRVCRNSINCGSIGRLEIYWKTAPRLVDGIRNVSSGDLPCSSSRVVDYGSFNHDTTQRNMSSDRVADIACLFPSGR